MTWALSCLAACAVNALVERRDRPPASSTLPRRPHE